MVQLQVLAHIFSPGVPHVSNFRKSINTSYLTQKTVFTTPRFRNVWLALFPTRPMKYLSTSK